MGAKTATGKVRWQCRGGAGDRTFCSSTTNAFADADNRSRTSPKPLSFKRKLNASVKTFIITTAQNATPIHKDFWQCLLSAKKAMKAELVVGPVRYKNPTSRWSSSQAGEEIWAPEIVPYMLNSRVRLNSNLVYLGDIKTQPTAVEPLSGFEAITGSESAIVLHTKVQLKSVATPSNKMAKLLMTTGACTVANYTDSRVGKLGEFHHSLSAIIVEIRGKIFYARHVHFDTKTKSFTDLNRRFTTTGSEVAPRPLALAMGDTHVDSIDPGVLNATFGEGGIVPTLRPQHLIWHDTLDSYSCNPHHFGNPFNALAKRQNGADDVQAEVNRAIKFIHKYTPPKTISVVVSSNHDDMLARWVIKNDWRMDPVNAQFYLETALAMVKNTYMDASGTHYPDPFTHWLSEASSHRKDIKILKRDESFMLAAVEFGMHGDRGPNGTRGSIKNLRRIGTKSIIGHSHSPGISEGCYQVGTSTRLSLEYVSGPSSWLNTHCILQADGKRQLITVVNGKWRGV